MLLTRRIFKPTVSHIRNFQVTVLGAASEVGQTVCLLLRAQPAITRLVVHDYLTETPGVVLDVSHIPSHSTLLGFSGDDTLDRALKDSHVVVAVGGVASRPGWTKQACFTSNAAFLKRVSSKIAKMSPMPFVCVLTEPINSMVPMAAEVLGNLGNYDGKKLFGITVIDLLRTQCMYAMERGLNPRDCFVPVIGGHSNLTMIPLLSQAKPYQETEEKQAQEFTLKVRQGDDIVTKAKKGFSPTLSAAYSTLIFVRGILNALEGYPSKVNAYIENNDFGTSYFSGLVNVDQNGAGEMDRYDNLSPLECHFLERSIVQLRKDISEGKKVLELASFTE